MPSFGHVAEVVIVQVDGRDGRLRAHPPRRMQCPSLTDLPVPALALAGL
jgi:hypothetical protein